MGGGAGGCCEITKVQSTPRMTPKTAQMQTSSLNPCEPTVPRGTRRKSRQSDRRHKNLKIDDACRMTPRELIEHLHAADSSQLVCIMTFGSVFPLTREGMALLGKVITDPFYFITCRAGFMTRSHVLQRTYT